MILGNVMHQAITYINADLFSNWLLGTNSEKLEMKYQNFLLSKSIW